jgi:hypothetical protein
VTKVLGATANGSAVADTRFAQSFLFDNYHYAYFLVYTNFDPSSSEAIQVVKQIRSNPSFLVGGLTSSLLDEISYSRVAYEQLELIIVLVIALVLALSLRSLSDFFERCFREHNLDHRFALRDLCQTSPRRADLFDSDNPLRDLNVIG